VHRPLGQQHQDGGADVATAAAPARPAAPSTARARTEAKTETARTETPAEARPETGPEARAEWPVVAGVVTADIVAELATGLPTVFVQCAPGMGVEAETLGSWAPRKRLAFMGEWVVHMSSRFWKGGAGCATDTTTIYRKLS
jgi:hypothetical protein